MAMAMAMALALVLVLLLLQGSSPISAPPRFPSIASPPSLPHPSFPSIPSSRDTAASPSFLPPSLSPRSRPTASIALSSPSMVGFYTLSLDTNMPRSQKPAWIDALLSEKFFAPCDAHSTSKKNDRNSFCLDCTLSICQHCHPDHGRHRLLQIRRYVYHDVIRIEDIQTLVDCSQVQPYIINSAKVVFLNQRPQARPLKGPSSLCGNCQRGLQESYKYCSIGCKVEAVMRRGEGWQMLFSSCSDVSSDLLLECTANSSCLTSSQTQENMRISAGSKALSMHRELDEEDEREQCSPNSVLVEQQLPLNCTSTSSGSCTASDELLPWRIGADGRESKVPRACVSNRAISLMTKRRKSKPQRSPVS